jgi:hypothetical protein
MTLKASVQSLTLGDDILHLCLHDNTPVVEFKEKVYKHLYLLIEEVKELSQPSNMKLFPIIANFFWKGTEFQFIDSIPNYQKQYQDRVIYEKQFPADVFEFRLTDYKIFDVSVMHDPAIEQGQIIFFVCNLTNGLPYRVVAPFPYNAPSSLVHYQILPVLEKDD